MLRWCIAHLPNWLNPFTRGALMRSAVGVFTRLSREKTPGLPKTNSKILLRQVRVAVTPRTRLLKARLANGTVVYGENRQGFGGRGVYIYGDAIEPEFEHLDKFLGESGVFVDIGASTGKYALKAAQHYRGKGVVLAIEPFLHVLATLERSVHANGFVNVRLRNFFVGEHTSAESFFMNWNEPIDFSLNQLDASAPSFSVLAVTLDDLFAWEGLDRLDYLKLDAMGSEELVLRGGRQTIEQYRPIIQLLASIDHSAAVRLDDYACFRSLHSPFKFYIPHEHDKIDVPKQLGWDVLS